METIMCAAIWYKEQPTATYNPINVDSGVVVCGHRHPHCIHTFLALTGKRSVLPECGAYEQGFLTSENRFVNRSYAAAIAKASGQLPIDSDKVYLFSEDLW